MAVACNSNTLEAGLEAFYRPPAISHAAYSVSKQAVSKAELASQKALVIGGSRRLGEVTAKYLPAGGAQVLLTFSRSAEEAQSVGQKILKHGGVACLAQFDLTSFDVKDLWVLEEFGQTECYDFATPFISSGQKNVFAEVPAQRLYEILFAWI